MHEWARSGAGKDRSAAVMGCRRPDSELGGEAECLVMEDSVR